MDTDTVLPANEQAADLVGAIRHELGHVLGIMGNISGTDNMKLNVKSGDAHAAEHSCQPRYF